MVCSCCRTVSCTTRCILLRLMKPCMYAPTSALEDDVIGKREEHSQSHRYKASSAPEL
uniref:Uncharacterized protein n=1 Tax=Anguilla anguilla TaxID=7936 RepID=A0A0E9TR81_ANGAN